MQGVSFLELDGIGYLEEYDTLFDLNLFSFVLRFFAVMVQINFLISHKVSHYV